MRLPGGAVDGNHLLDAPRSHLQFAAAAKILQALG